MGDAERLLQRNRPLLDAIRQRQPVNELHDQKARSFHRAAGVVKRADVRMVERRDRRGLPFEPLAEPLRGNLDRNIPLQLRIPRTIHVAHPTRTDEGKYFVRCKTGTGLKRGHFARQFNKFGV
jgi:hypothetical protein